ncbi:MAG: RNA 2'-phosphotransferase [Spirochaetales bacterium]|nr:RNA 2'-phosphotransferase [Spirochaetales bacterium]
MEKELIKLSKFLSLILRHKPEVIHISLDSHGWADVNEIIKGIKIRFPSFDLAALKEVVEKNDKKRFAFSEDQTKIRANQGHSREVDLDLEAVKPPDFLYHGTAKRFLAGIRQQGLLKWNRQFVHLSRDHETAVKVGKRHGRPVVLLIDAKKMHEQGKLFYLSKNGVWLTEKVDPEYIIFEEE